MKISVQTKVKTRQICAATGKVVSESPWRKNLILDNGLNALARSTNSTTCAGFTTACRIGDGTTPTSYSSGAITFTQAGTTLTASGAFFTPAMAGMLFKWGAGSGGVEAYISSYTNATTVTLASSATVSTPTVGTVWCVNQTTLANLLYSSSTYETTAGSCGSSFNANQATHKRTYNFAQQVSPYNVNEIGYFNSTSGTTVYGRIVLPSTDVVAPTNFYQVVLSVTFTFSPSVPTAVADVGTNINTAGSAMFENISDNQTFFQVLSGGTTSSATNALFDTGGVTSLKLIIANYTQNTIVGSRVPMTVIHGPTNLSWVYGGTRGKMTCTFNAGISTAGQTLYGIGLAISATSLVCFDVKLATPFVLPTGTFLPQTVFAFTFDRTLTN